MLVYFGLIVYQICLMLVANKFSTTKKRNIIFIILFSLPLVLLSSLKASTVGVDTVDYLKFYKNDVIYENEPIFTLLNSIFHSIGLPYFVFLIFCYSIIWFGISIFAYKKTSNPLLLIFFVAYFGFLGFSLSGLRQALAIGVIFIGFAFFSTKRPITVLIPTICIVIAVFIHRVSFAIAPALIIPFIKIDKKSFLYVFAVLVLLSILSPFLYSNISLMGKNASYLPVLTKSNFTLIIVILFTVLVFLISLYKFPKFEDKFLKRFDDKKVFNVIGFKEENDGAMEVNYSNILLCLLIPVLILCIGIYSTHFPRFNYYYIPFTGLLLVTAINNRKYLKVTRNIIDVLLILFLILYFVIAVLLKDPLGVANYKIGPML